MSELDHQVDAKEYLRQSLADSGHEHVKVGVFDIDGVLRGKYMSTSKLLSSLDKGFGFCDVVLGWDVADELYSNSSFTGWHSGFPDAPVRIIPDSLRQLPADGGIPFLLCEFDKAAATLCPRGVLRRVLQRALDAGYVVNAGFEYEFFVFDETSESLRAKNFENLTPLSRDSSGYSMLRTTQQAEFYRAILEGCAKAGISIEGLHEETGEGVLEAAIAVSPGMKAADSAALFKVCAKVIANQHDKVATFMAKCNAAWPGQSGHIHVSLQDPAGASLFFDEAAPDSMSETMRYFLGGQQRLMPEILAMVAPTINSYRRLVPGYWAPTSANWGVENRTGALRAINGSASSQRVEYRVASADANPYLALAAAVASGLWGIENRVEPDEALEGNGYESVATDATRLPQTLWEAAQKFRHSKAARSLFGDEFVEHFAATREWEEQEFRKHVTDWERRRYFEII